MDEVAGRLSFDLNGHIVENMEPVDFYNDEFLKQAKWAPDPSEFLEWHGCFQK